MKLLERDNCSVVDLYVSPLTHTKLEHIEFIALNDYSMGEPIPKDWPKPIHTAITKAISLGAELLYIKQRSQK